MRAFGFTLIDLLITLSVISILLALGSPSFSGQIQNLRVKTATQSLQESIAFTRAQAVRSNKRATIAKQHNWNEGWEIFIDEDNDGVRDSNEPTVLQQEKLSGVRVIANKYIKNYVSYIGTGESRYAGGTATGAFQAGTFTICPEGKGKGYELILARGGRVRTKSIGEHTCAAI